MAHRLSRSLAALFLACFAFGSAHAAEMGEPRVASHIGQQLVADIELASLEDPSKPVQARLASPDVYRGASIAMPPVLASLSMSVMRRDDRQFLHLTSLKPVDADHLHVFLELIDGGQRSVRLVTLWLTPDPAPAPIAAPARAAIPVPAPAAIPAAAAPVRAAVPAAAVPTPAAIPAAAVLAPAAIPAAGVAAPAAVPAAIAVPTRATGPAPVTTPRRPPVHAVARADSIPAVPARASPPQHLAPSAKPAPSREAPMPAALHAAAPATCPGQFAPAQVNACAALDNKSAALRQQIGQLEGKVKLLQAAMRAAPAAAPPHLPKAAPAIQATPAKPAARPGLVTQKQAKRKRQPDEAPIPWLWIGIGAALLAAGGGTIVGVRNLRARKAKKAKLKEIVVTPNVMGGVKSRLMADAPASARPAAPAME